MRESFTRLSKLEAKRGLTDGATFYVFGMDEEDAAGRHAVELRAGTLDRTDSCRTVIWRGPAQPPQARWSSPRNLTNDELDDAIATLAAAAGYDVPPRGYDAATNATLLTVVRSDLAEASTLPRHSCALRSCCGSSDCWMRLTRKLLGDRRHAPGRGTRLPIRFGQF